MDILKKELQENNIAKVISDEKSYKDFISRNAIAKIFDVVSDGRKAIRVERIWHTGYYNEITIVYSGPEVTLEKNIYRPYKRGSIGYAHQIVGKENPKFKVLFTW